MKKLLALLLAVCVVMGCLSAVAEEGWYQVPMEYTARENQSGHVDDSIWLYYGLLTVNMAQRGDPLSDFLAALEEKHVYCREITREKGCCTLAFLEEFSLRIYVDDHDAIQAISLIITCPRHHLVYEIKADLSFTMPEIRSGNVTAMPAHTYSKIELSDQDHDAMECLSAPHLMSSKAATALFHALQLSVASVNREEPEVVELTKENWRRIFWLIGSDDFTTQTTQGGYTAYGWKLVRDLVMEESGSLMLFCAPDNAARGSIVLTMVPPMLPDLFVFLNENLVEEAKENGAYYAYSYNFTDSTDVYFDESPIIVK